MEFNPEDWTVVEAVDVRWGDMDAFNHVNNTIYFRYFESARIAYFKKVLWGIDQDNPVGPILAHTSCRFMLPVTYPDQLQIGIRATKIGNSSLVQEYIVFSEKLGVAATGDSVVVCFDYNSKQKINIPDDLRKRIRDVEILEI